MIPEGCLSLFLFSFYPKMSISINPYPFLRLEAGCAADTIEGSNKDRVILITMRTGHNYLSINQSINVQMNRIRNVLLHVSVSVEGGRGRVRGGGGK